MADMLKILDLKSFKRLHNHLHNHDHQRRGGSCVAKEGRSWNGFLGIVCREQGFTRGRPRGDQGATRVTKGATRGDQTGPLSSSGFLSFGDSILISLFVNVIPLTENEREKHDLVGAHSLQLTVSQNRGLTLC